MLAGTHVNTLTQRRWVGYTVLAAVSWGIWGTLTKYISDEVSPFSYQLLFTSGMLFSLPFLLRRLKTQVVTFKGIVWGVAISCFATIGNICVYQSFTFGGKASVVIPLSNLYPLVTILIAIAFFKERIHWLNAFGILIVFPAILMLSGQSEILYDPLAYFRTTPLERWTLYAFLSMIFFGVFNASQKVIANLIAPEWSYLSFIISSALISIGFIVFGLVDFSFSTRTFWVGSAAGMFDGLGVLAMYAAYAAKGKASQVSPVAATLQQIFTIGLAILILREKLSTGETIGMLMAILGTYLILFEQKKVIEV
jgi:drug/metabolite transporter (DMT)-like permease